MVIEIRIENMEVICKTNSMIYDKHPRYFMSITLSKSYKVLSITQNAMYRVYGSDLDTFFYEIVDDTGHASYYPQQLFKSPDEIREEKLEQLLKEK